MAEAIDGDDADDADGHVYSVRPEPPRFEELVRLPALYSNDSPFKPPGPILRWFGSQRLRVLFSGRDRGRGRRHCCRNPALIARSLTSG